MNTQNRTTPPRRQYPPYPGRAAVRLPEPPQQLQEDFDESAPELVVEHATIPGFLRRIPYRFSMEDLTRFGTKVGKAAEAMQIAFITTVERSLGTIRVFPLPLLRRVYEVMGMQFGWPKIIEVEIPGLPSGGINPAETLKAHERLEQYLRGALEMAADDTVQHSITVVLQWLEMDCERIRKDLGQEHRR
jgi:hypothetical protein